MNLLMHRILSSISHLKRGAINIEPEKMKKIMLPELTFAFSLYFFLQKLFKEKRMSIILSIVIEPINDTSKMSNLRLDASVDLENDLYPDKTLEELKIFKEIHLKKILDCLTSSIALTTDKKPHTIIAKGEVNTDPNLQVIECEGQISKEFINTLLTSKNCTGIEFEFLNKVISIPSKSRFVKHHTALLKETISGIVRFHKIGYDNKARAIGEVNLDFIFESKYLLQLNELFIKSRYTTAYFKQDVRSKIWRLIDIVPLPKNQTEFSYMD